MRTTLWLLALISMTTFAAGDQESSPLASMEVKKSRVQGSWQVRCEIDHPAEAQTAEVGKLLQQACRGAAARFAAKDHSQTGGLYRQDVSAPKSSRDGSKLFVEIVLHTR